MTAAVLRRRRLGLTALVALCIVPAVLPLRLALDAPRQDAARTALPVPHIAIYIAIGVTP